jgi:hypothetical protein
VGLDVAVGWDVGAGVGVDAGTSSAMSVGVVVGAVGVRLDGASVARQETLQNSKRQMNRTALFDIGSS